MRPAIAIVLVSIVVTGCGSRTTLGGGSPGSSSSLSPAPVLSPIADADAGAIPLEIPDADAPTCFGGVSRLPRVSCRIEMKGGATCAATITCDDHVLTMDCESGLCRCDNVGFERCFCNADPRDGSPCAGGGCCWL